MPPSAFGLLPDPCRANLQLHHQAQIGGRNYVQITQTNSAVLRAQDCPPCTPCMHPCKHTLLILTSETKQPKSGKQNRYGMAQSTTPPVQKAIWLLTVLQHSSLARNAFWDNRKSSEQQGQIEVHVRAFAFCGAGLEQLTQRPAGETLVWAAAVPRASLWQSF